MTTSCGFLKFLRSCLGKNFSLVKQPSHQRKVPLKTIPGPRNLKYYKKREDFLQVLGFKCNMSKTLGSLPQVYHDLNKSIKSFSRL